jgi:hypothetical protein
MHPSYYLTEVVIRSQSTCAEHLANKYILSYEVEKVVFSSYIKNLSTCPHKLYCTTEYKLKLSKSQRKQHMQIQKGKAETRESVEKRLLTAKGCGRKRCVLMGHGWPEDVGMLPNGLSRP